MKHRPLPEDVYAVLALGGVGLWTILTLGRAGFSPGGIPGLPALISRGRGGRVTGVVLILVGATFVAFAAVAAGQLVSRLCAGDPGT